MLAKKVKENSESQKELTEMSKRLEKSVKKQYEALIANQQEMSEEEFETTDVQLDEIDSYPEDNDDILDMDIQ